MLSQFSHHLSPFLWWNSSQKTPCCVQGVLPQWVRGRLERLGSQGPRAERRSAAFAASVGKHLVLHGGCTTRVSAGRVVGGSPESMVIWLVVWLPWILFAHEYWVANHPNWRSHIFQRGWNHQPVIYWDEWMVNIWWTLVKLMMATHGSQLVIMGVSTVTGVPRNRWFISETIPLNGWWLGVPLFQETNKYDGVICN